MSEGGSGGRAGSSGTSQARPASHGSTPYDAVTGNVASSDAGPPAVVAGAQSQPAAERPLRGAAGLSVPDAPSTSGRQQQEQQPQQQPPQLQQHLQQGLQAQLPQHSPQQLLQLQNLNQHLGYSWYQPQRSHPFQQGQTPPYGWLSYGLGYQMYGDQLGQHGYLPESQMPSHLPGQVPGQMPPYSQMPFQGQHEMPGYPLGGAPQGFLQHPFFPHMMQMPVGRGRPSRATKPPEEASDSYNFDLLEARERPQQARTTLMLRNIPNKYTIHMLLDMLDKCHKRAPNELVYDFCYLPIDFKNRCNLGYAFVNFVDAASTAECYVAFNSKRWNDFNSKKVCEVKYARVQGKSALIEHFRNSKFPSNDIDCLPLLFEKAELETGEQIVRSVPLHSRQGT